jgi:hypothetical protein
MAANDSSALKHFAKFLRRAEQKAYPDQIGQERYNLLVILAEAAEECVAEAAHPTSGLDPRAAAQPLEPIVCPLCRETVDDGHYDHCTEGWR